MIRATPATEVRPPEPPAGQPEASGEAWLGRNASAKRRLWSRLNPRHRKLLYVFGRALALRQSQARLQDSIRAPLLIALDELERLAARVERLLVSVANRTPPGG